MSKIQRPKMIVAFLIPLLLHLKIALLLFKVNFTDFKSVTYKYCKDFCIYGINANTFDTIWEEKRNTGIHKGFVKAVILELYNSLVIHQQQFRRR